MELRPQQKQAPDHLASGATKEPVRRLSSRWGAQRPPSQKTRASDLGLGMLNFVLL
jgi:hypothetical protein